MRDRITPTVRTVRKAVAASVVGLLLLLASALLQHRSPFFTDRIGAPIYELFGLLAAVAALELWLTRSAPISRRHPAHKRD